MKREPNNKPPKKTKPPPSQNETDFEWIAKLLPDEANKKNNLEPNQELKKVPMNKVLKPLVESFSRFKVDRHNSWPKPQAIPIKIK